MYSDQQVALLMSYLGTISVIGIVFAVLSIVANWRIFTKAGEAGWKSIIPIYNGYICYKIAWKTTMFWVVFIMGFVAGICYTMAGNAVVLAIALILVLAAGVISIIYNVKLAKAFGKGAGFAVGLIFLGPIFQLILAFGSAQYVGADR